MSVRSLVLIVAVSACLGAPASANLLNNPGFEDPLGFDFSNPYNWNGFFGGPAGTYLEAFNWTGATPHGGAQALVTTIRGVAGVTDGFNAFTGHVQRVDGIVAGAPYELSVWARTNPLVLDGAEFRVEWQDSDGVEVGRENFPIQGLLTSEYQRFSIFDTAPANASRALIVLAVQSFDHTGALADTSVAWDDAVFVQVPAPGAVAIAGAMGVLGLRRRRA
jgi:hypothetical protein